MKIIISIILNLAAVMYNVACIASNKLAYIIAIRNLAPRAEFESDEAQEDGFLEYLNSNEVKAWEKAFELYHGEVE